MNEEKQIEMIEYECINCDWNGTVRSMTCKSRGNIELKVTPNSKGEKVSVHKINKEGLQRCDGCGYLDDKCPVCGDEVGKPGVREEIRKLKLAEEKAEREAIDSGAKGGAVY